MTQQTATAGPWKHYSAKLRPQFPTKIHEIHDAKGAVIVKWSGFDGVEQKATVVRANCDLLAAAPALRDELRALIEIAGEAAAFLPSGHHDTAAELRARMEVASTALASAEPRGRGRG
jgi:hypothetical protein